MTESFFHGGFPGLGIGEYVECPDLSGTEHTLSQYVGSDAPHGSRTDVVYVTTRQDTARVYAAFYPNGSVYRVEPEGVVGYDPDDLTGQSVMCRRARVIEVVRERVVFAHRTPDSWIRLLNAA